MAQIKPITKDEELNVLKRAIAALGDNSYVGPWLADQLPFIENAMRSDLPLTPMSEEVDRAYEQAEEMRKTARRDAHGIIEGAKAHAKLITEEARKTKNDLLIRFRSQLRQAGIID